MVHHPSIRKLLEKARDDETLRHALENTVTPEEVVAAATGAGLTVTVEEICAFQQYLKALLKERKQGELTDNDLENVAGGFNPFSSGGAVLLGASLIGGPGFLAAGAVALGMTALANK